MSRHKESDFAEVVLDRLILESFPDESSAYHQSEFEKTHRKDISSLKSKVLWHINRSLSPRQKEVIKLIIQGKKEREIAEKLGIKQQVVNIYKHRAIKKLRSILLS